MVNTNCTAGTSTHTWDDNNTSTTTSGTTGYAYIRVAESMSKAKALYHELADKAASKKVVALKKVYPLPKQHCLLYNYVVRAKTQRRLHKGSYSRHAQRPRTFRRRRLF
jgi:hypothetical protein